MVQSVRIRKSEVELKKPADFHQRALKFVVPTEGLEPPHPKAHGPEPCASTNSATWATEGAIIEYLAGFGGIFLSGIVVELNRAAVSSQRASDSVESNGFLHILAKVDPELKKPADFHQRALKFVVPTEGLEPPHPKAHGPEPCASTNSATWATENRIIN